MTHYTWTIYLSSTSCWRSVGPLVLQPVQDFSDIDFNALGLGNISINFQYRLIKYPQYNHCMHLAFTILSSRQYLSHLSIISHLSSNLCQFWASYFIQFMHTSTNHVNWLICQREVVFLNYFSVKTSTYIDIKDFSNYVVVLQFFLHAILQ